jgi:hypothetical protein
MSSRAEALSSSEPALPLFAYWHLLSLDAPTIAALWCCAFAAAVGERIAVGLPVALAFTTWILYVSDRLLDARSRPPDAALQQRHLFHARHARAMLIAICGGAVATVAIAAVTHGPAMRMELLLGIAVIAYFVFVHSISRRPRRGFSKEAAVAIIFASATVIPAWCGPAGGRQLFPAALAFAALCWINCTAIESWESHAANTRAPRMWMACTALIIASAFCIDFATHAEGIRLLLAATGLSALIIGALDLHRRRLSPLALRVAADAALLTPLLLVPFLH